jgi:hypothetical protein
MGPWITLMSQSKYKRSHIRPCHCLSFPSSLPSTSQRLVSLCIHIPSFQPRSFNLDHPILQLSQKSIKMRSDFLALTAAVAGCAVAAPAARPQWGSWGQDGGWGNGGGWGMGSQDPPAGGSGIPAPAPSMPAATGTAAPFPTGTGVAPIGTGVIPTGTGAVQPIRAAATGTAPVGTAPVASASPATSGSAESSAGQTGESTDASGVNALFVAKGKEYFGTCADPGTLGSEAADIIKADFGQITPENRYDNSKRRIFNVHLN